jgi:hypothetical protein
MVTLPGQAKRGRQAQVTIPQPYEDTPSLYRTALATKELVETLAGQRGQAYDVAITWQDLLNLGWIRKEDIPYDVGSHPI